MGGVDVNVKERIPIGGTWAPAARSAASPARSTPGRQHLNGYHALWFARSRASTDDFSRMRRQRCMVGALVDQVNPVSCWRSTPHSPAVAKNNIQVDIPPDELPACVELVQRMQRGSDHAACH